MSVLKSFLVNVGFDEKASRRFSKRRYTVVDVEARDGIKDWHLVSQKDNTFA